MSKKEPWQIREDRKSKKSKLMLRKRYLICTEGKTEVIYLQYYKSSTGPVVTLVDKSNNKLNLVKKTIEERDRQLRAGELDEDLDEVWVVLDRDTHLSNEKDKSYFKQALELAAANKISVAYSNDSIELWFLLHYQALWSAKHRNELCEMLTKHLGRKYKKPDDLYREIKPFRSLAIHRAEELMEYHNHCRDANPSTTMHRLVSNLMNEPGFRED